MYDLLQNHHFIYLWPSTKITNSLIWPVTKYHKNNPLIWPWTKTNPKNLSFIHCYSNEWRGGFGGCFLSYDLQQKPPLHWYDLWLKKAQKLCIWPWKTNKQKNPKTSLSRGSFGCWFLVLWPVTKANPLHSVALMVVFYWVLSWLW